MAEHVRDHRSVLAAAEKRLLVAIAGRLPASIHSDHLTALALLAMGLAGAAYALARWDVRFLWLAVAALALNWFGDSLDGTVARVRHHERPRYGFYVDHVLDIVGATLLFAGLGASGFMTPYNIRSVVVLPAPFGPSRPVMAPSRASNATLLTAWTEPKRFFSPSTRITAHHSA